jgi:hypothetical protein
MTFERKIVAGLDDIRAVVSECMKCHSRLAISPDNADTFPQRCSRCSQQWILQDPTSYSSVDSPMSNFLRGVAETRVLIKSGVLGVKILLEFDEPKGSQ